MRSAHTQRAHQKLAPPKVKVTSVYFSPQSHQLKKVLWGKNHENPSDRKSHTWAPLKVVFSSHIYCTLRKLCCLILWFNLCFMVLSSEIGLAKSGLIRKLFIKGRGAEVSENSVRPPSCGSPLKNPPHLVQLLQDPNCQQLYEMARNF
jgi:hypothetical protein